MWNGRSRMRASMTHARAVKGVDHIDCKNILTSKSSTIK